MPTTLIGRLVFWDLIRITLISLVVVSGLFVLVGAMAESRKFGLEPYRFLKIVPYLIPPTFPITLPASLLFACTFVYGRLAANQEITALKAAGIHVVRILLPGLILSVAASAAAMLFVDQIVPACHRQVARIIMNDIETNIYAYLRQTGMITRPDFPYEIYVQEVRDDKLINAIFKHRNAEGRYDIVAQAAEAVITVDDFRDGAEPVVNVRLINYDAWSKDGRFRLPDKTYQMPIPTSFSDAELKTKTLSSRECLAQSDEHFQQAVEGDLYLSSSAAIGALGGELRHFSQVIKGNRTYTQRQYRKSRELLGEFHARWSHSSAAFVFALLGCPMGILLQRRDFLQVFFLCFVPILTIYYPAVILAQNLVKEGFFPAAISLWIPTFALAMAAIPVLRRVIRY